MERLHEPLPGRDDGAARKETAPSWRGGASDQTVNTVVDAAQDVSASDTTL